MPIASAIQNRHLLGFIYDGHARVVEPHIYGVDRRGREFLSAFQAGGGSASGEAIGWKLFHVERMAGVRVLLATFSGPRKDYNPEDAVFSRVHARL